MMIEDADEIADALDLIGVGIKNKKASDYSEAFKINMAATYSPAFLCSTIGHEGLNFSVRNGKR